MRAITIPQYGDEDVLTLSDVAPPVVRDGEVLIDVAAAGVNRADLLQRQGHYPPPEGASDLPGLEVSGTLAGTGDEVCAVLAGGGYAEQVTAPEGQILPVPQGVSLIDAAGLPEVTCTVWSNLVMTAHLAAGETVLLHGGSSGIGTMGIQIAKALGARVAVTAGSAAKLDVCRDLGADILINYRDEDFVERMREVGGADVILDLIGAKYLGRNIDALATGGRLVIIGMQGGIKGELNIAKLLAKRASVTATSLRARPLEEKAPIVRSVREHVWPLIESGQVRPIIDRTFPLEQAAEAHRTLAESSHIGKVLLTVAG